MPEEKTSGLCGGHNLGEGIREVKSSCLRSEEEEEPREENLGGD